jgi:transcriptional regulator
MTDERSKRRDDLMPGTLEMLVLKTLMRGPLHGYGISQRLRQLSEDVLQVEEGSLYPALQRLEVKGWVTSEWRMSEKNRRARFYRLTPAGRVRLKAEVAKFGRVASAFARVLRTA